MESDDPDAINAKLQALAQAAMKIGQALYEKQQAEQAGADASADAAASGDDVVDAEFEEVDGDEKKSA